MEKNTFTLLSRKPSALYRLDVWPFVICIYPILYGLHLKYSESEELFGDSSLPVKHIVTFVCGIFIILHIVIHLFTYWNANWNCFISFDKAYNIEKATHVFIKSYKYLNRITIVPITNNTVSDSNIIVYGLEYFNKKYEYVGICPDDKSKKTPLAIFRSVKTPVNQSLNYYASIIKERKGLSTAEANYLLIKNGLNNFNIVLPAFMELYKEHMTAPFFVFQLFCILLWLLDEYWMYSLLTLFLLVFMEAQLVLKRLSDMRNIKDMRLTPCPVYVYRDKKWKLINTDYLVPGDIFLMSNLVADSKNLKNDSQLICPCDALVLQGSAVLNESVLTGESVPLCKVALFLDNSSENTNLDIKSHHRQHVILSGSSLIYTLGHSESGDQVFKDVPDSSACVCYVLRTGFETFQGKIVRTILHSSERLNAENKEAYLFLLILTFFSILASLYVVYYAWFKSDNTTRNGYKLLLKCITIITSVVPPEFPITLSMAVTISLVDLVKKKIYCTEPFRLPLAGKVTVCAFDKTGTLTSDKMDVEGIVGIPGYKDEALESKILKKDESNIVDSSTNSEVPSSQLIPFSTLAVLVGCQSLTSFNGTILGEYDEKKILTASKWAFKTSDLLFLQSDHSQKIKIIKRYPFFSELQRMTTVVEYSANHRINEFSFINNSKKFKSSSEANSSNNEKQKDSGYNSPYSHIPIRDIYVLCKGSPEMIFKLLDNPPSDYEFVYNQLSIRGYRVLALAYKQLTEGISISSLKTMKRDDFENKLMFAGFLVMSCPVKRFSLQTIQQLNNSLIRNIMITGDNPLTACQIAYDVNIMCMPSHYNKETVMNHCLLLSGITHNDSVFELKWISRDSKFSVNIKINQNRLNEFDKLLENHVLCISGNYLELLKDIPENIFNYLIKNITVFSRVSPKQKESIILSLKASNEIVIMCGDGTNDVGALKVSDVGISLLNKKDVKDSKLPLKPKPNLKTLNNFIEESQQILEWENNSMKSSLSASSIASPFTHRGKYVKCVSYIIIISRATLASIMTSYKTIAINSLLTAFCLSVLTLDGVKFSDFQSSVEGIFISILVFLYSTVKAPSELTTHKPTTSLFSLSVLTSIFGQTLVHLVCLIIGWNKAKQYMNLNSVEVEVNESFTPNIVNTAIFFIHCTSHGSSFLANYAGYPFLLSMSQNTYFLRALVFFFVCLFVLVFECFPEFNAFLSLVAMPNLQFKLFFVILLATEIILSWTVGYLCKQLELKSS